MWHITPDYTRDLGASHAEDHWNGCDSKGRFYKPIGFEKIL